VNLALVIFFMDVKILMNVLKAKSSLIASIYLFVHEKHITPTILLALLELGTMKVRRWMEITLPFLLMYFPGIQMFYIVIFVPIEHMTSSHVHQLKNPITVY